VRTALLAAALVGALAAPAPASAATLSVSPTRACYGSGQTVDVTGTGYTPNGGVNFTADDVLLATLPVDGNGVFGGSLRVGLASGERVKTYAATDQANAALTASKELRVSAVNVTVSPQDGRPGRRLRIRARGFTLGKKRLYAHIRRGRHYRRTVRIGRLRGACRKLRTRKRLFSSRARAGAYKLQFDTRLRYSRSTRQRVVFTVEISRSFSPASAAVRRG